MRQRRVHGGTRTEREAHRLSQALGSIFLFLTPSTGSTAGWEIIAFRLVQAVGPSFLFANSSAILTDAFPPNQRGLGLGINQIAAVGGSVAGLVLGGVLAAVNWRLVFLVSVPLGIIGTVWAYLMLRETATIREHQRIDVWGNVTFAAGLTVLLIGLTFHERPARRLLYLGSDGLHCLHRLPPARPAIHPRSCDAHGLTRVSHANHE